MEIVLLRHGKPKVQTDTRLSAAEFAAWVAEYNDAGIDLDCAPPKSAVQLVEKGVFVVCSNLRRSRESAHALGVEIIGACESTFRELELPYASWRFPRLSALAWAALFQFIWMAGYSANGEPFKASLKRARHCAERLAELANLHGTVLLVGHGSLNWFIARELKRMGWTGPRLLPRKYWEFSVYRYETT